MGRSPLKRALEVALPICPPADRAARLALRKRRAVLGAYPDYPALFGPHIDEWRKACQDAQDGPRVLCATSVGGMLDQVYIDSLVAIALTLRGAKVEVLLCDGVLPACQDCTYRWFASPARFADAGPQPRLCGSCFAPARRVFEQLGLKVHTLGSVLTGEDREHASALAASTPFAEIGRSRWHGVPIGEHALAGAIRFFAADSLDREPAAEGVARRYLEASALSAAATRRLISQRSYDTALVHHGIYTPQGPIACACRDAGVRVTTWNPAYRAGCFVFSHDDTYHRTLLDEPTDSWTTMPWTDAMRTRVMGYLDRRRTGADDWIWFHDNPRFDLEREAARLGLDLSKPYVGLLTNVAWDARLHYGNSVYPGMLDWLIDTIGRFAKRSDIQLLVRIHPAEVTAGLPSRQPASAEIRRAFPELPANIIIVGPEDNASTYALMERANAAIVYGTKTGVELAARGLPVIVAGEAWVRGKGFTRDADTIEQYAELLDALPFADRMSPQDTERARRYAYHFFFRRMIPVSAVSRGDNWRHFRINIRGLSPLRFGECPGMDLITSGILNATPYTYDAQGAAATSANTSA